MTASDQAAVRLDALTASFGWARQDEVVQQDVQELNRVLFTAVDQSLSGTPAVSVSGLSLHPWSQLRNGGEGGGAGGRGGEDDGSTGDTVTKLAGK